MGNQTSIHLEDFMSCKKTYANNQINKKWTIIKNVRKVATGAIEKIREEKIIRSSLEAHLDIYLGEDIYKNIKDVYFDEIAITSSFKLHKISKISSGFELEDIPNIKVKASKVYGYKCQRCWKYEQKLIKDEICKRCNDAINYICE